MAEKGNAANRSVRQIEIRKAEEDDLPRIVDMLSARLVDSVEQSYILEGICAKEELTHFMLAVQTEEIYRIGEVWIAGDFQGSLSGFYGKSGFSIASLVRMSLRQNTWLKKNLSKADLKQLNANMKKMAGTTNTRWRKQVCGGNDYFYLQLVALDSSLKGSGAFRQLVEPILARLEQEKMPVLLDTHDKSNVSLYEHFGFHLEREHHAKSGAPIVQYSMIKRCE